MNDNNTNRAALYCRLSKEDIDKINKGDDSASIINQRILLEDYAANKGFSIYKVYQDDDYSGLFDDRPGFESMIEDAKNGKFGIIIAKTQSRFTRNMEHMEHYLHDVFPSLGIRFIGVVDNADTKNKGNKKARQINGLINEWYCEDLSENVRAVFKSKMKKGQYLGSSAPYGYIKDPKDNHKLIIDEYSADIIKRIFALYLAGNSKYHISQILNSEGILIPTKYKKEVLKSTYYNPRSSSDSVWTEQTIHTILNNEVYIGAVVQNKQASVSYKNRKKYVVPEKERIKVYNMHEPIIDLDTWELTQKALKLRTRETHMEKKVDLFSEKLYCADCGKNLVRCHNRKHEFIGYYCAAYKKFGNKGCTSHQIGFKELKSIVLSEIQKSAKEILSPDDVEYLQNSAKKMTTNYHEIQLKQFKQKLETASNYIDKIYKDYLDGLISREEYIKYRNKYNSEQNEIQAQIEVLTAQFSDEKSSEKYKNTWLEKFTDYINVDELDRIMVLELIDKIEVTNDGEVHIAFRFNRGVSFT
ncbi:MAG: recombinase family protein [Candidatus Ornithomonoglobus sp.]